MLNYELCSKTNLTNKICILVLLTQSEYRQESSVKATSEAAGSFSVAANTDTTFV